MRKFIGGVVLALLCLFFLSAILTASHGSSSAASSGVPNSSAVQTATAAASTSPWHYAVNKDPLTDKTSTSACIDSVNQVQFDFPYQGGSTGTLCFYRRPGHPMLANLRVDRGQFLCNTEGCHISVRVGDGAIQRFGAGEPSNYSSTVLVVDNAEQLLKRITAGTRLRIAADFYQAGPETFEFTSAQFDPKQLANR